MNPTFISILASLEFLFSICMLVMTGLTWTDASADVKASFMALAISTMVGALTLVRLKRHRYIFQILIVIVSITATLLIQ